MPIYTVHAPPAKPGFTPDPERFVFVRDGFHFWAFLLTPLWMIWRRLWLVLVLYVLVLIVLQIALRLIGATPTVHTLVGLLLSLLVGFEAATLRRWTLNRRRWNQLAVVSAPNREAAERRFFDSWLRQAAWEAVRDSPSPATPPPSHSAPASSDVVGLFPEPQSRP
ncbi:MAG TPA: DUF2628 domain-containing protein [Xanthobacteraceae bacterium]|nr:DUF2628 domain-containing protein [Xanthobacteraceae bacterium]